MSKQVETKKKGGGDMTVSDVKVINALLEAIAKQLERLEMTEAAAIVRSNKIK